jgi:hypothetical protein
MYYLASLHVDTIHRLLSKNLEHFKKAVHLLPLLVAQAGKRTNYIPCSPPAVNLDPLYIIYMFITPKLAARVCIGS